MRIFLTGGTGLIGSHLVPALLERGDEVVILTRNAARARRRLPAGEFIEGNPTIPNESWQWNLGTCDAVINLAGESLAAGLWWTSSVRQRLRQSRLATTRNVAEAMHASERTRLLVSASAVGYYGDRGSEALDESTQPGQGFLARLTREWESTALLAEGKRTRVVLLRTGIVLASDGGVLPLMQKTFRFGLGGVLGDGRQYFPWIHITDHVRVILLALDQADLAGPVNAVVPDPPTQQTFVRSLAGVMGKPAVLRMPAFLLRGLLGQKSEMVLSSQRVVPRALRARGFRFRYPDLTGALEDLLGEGTAGTGSNQST
jgi:uncharacterized protein (TIGR01777 family)